ncbi:MAG: tetratricopeptide repeat protein [Candidatus Brocadiia bacterium]
MKWLCAAILLALAVAVCASRVRPAAAEAMESPTRIMEFADGLFERGIYDLAAREYEIIVTNFKDFAGAETARFRLGECMFLQGKFAEAIPHYEKLVGSPGQDFDAAARLRIGICKLNLKDYEGAEKSLTALNAPAYPDRFRLPALYYLGRCRAAAGDSVQAAAWYEEAAKSGEYAAAASFARADLAVGASDWATARLYFQRCADIAADANLKYSALLRLGDVLERAGQKDDASRLYDELAKAPPADSPEFPALDALLAKSGLFLRAGDYGKAFAAAADAMVRFARSGRIAEAAFAAAEALSADGKWKNAGEHYEKALSGTLPAANREAAQDGFLRAQLEIQNYAAALAFIPRIAAQPPDRFVAWYYIASAHQKGGDKKEAVRIANILSVTGPEPWLRLSRILLANANFETADYAGTVSAVSRFRAFYPADEALGSMLCRAGDSQLCLGDWKGAVVSFTEGLSAAAAPDVKAYARYRRACALYANGEKDKMAEDLRAVVDDRACAGYRDSVLMLLGDFHSERGDHPSAIVCYKRILDESKNSRHRIPASIRLAGAYYSRNLFDNSAAIYLSLVREGRASAMDVEILYWVSDYLASKGKVPEALEIVEAGMALTPPVPERVPEFLFRKATLLLTAKDYPGCEKACSDLLTRFNASPRKYDTYLIMARSKRATGKLADAEATLRELSRDSSGKVKSRALIELAGIEYDSKRYSDALRDYLFVAVLEDEESLAAPALLGAARASLGLKRADDAARYATELIKRFPASPLRKDAEALLPK